MNKIEEIINEYYKTDILNLSRKKQYKIPRHIFCYVCRKIRNDIYSHKYSLNQIKNYLGFKYHTTVMHAVKTIERDKHSDFELETDINIILHKINTSF